MKSNAKARSACTIGAPIETVYAFWRNFENAPRFMRHIASVVQYSSKESHWVHAVLGNRSIEWDSVVTNEKRHRAISWKTKTGSEFPHRGTVSFSAAPADRGTEVRVSLEFHAPAGKLGKGLAKILGQDPGELLKEDLRRLKMLLETDEIADTSMQPSGKGRRR